MVKQILPVIAFLVFLSSCSTFKPLNFTSNKQVVTSPEPASPAKFIEEISVTPQVTSNNKRLNLIPTKLPISGLLQLKKLQLKNLL